MANSISAEKRVRQNARRRARNRWRMTRIRNAIKEFRETILHGSAEQAETQLKGLYKLVDQIAATGTIHRNAAARYKSRLSAQLNHKKAPAPAGA